jgi:phosphoribosylglycinamide formyltransferase-1
MKTAKELFERAIAEALRLPQVETERKGSHVALKVGSKIFAYLVNDHHGDGIVGLCCKAFPGERESLLAVDPRRFYRVAYTQKSWIGLRLDVGRVSWREVRELLEGSYRLTAGKRQIAMLDAKSTMRSK